MAIVMNLISIAISIGALICFIMVLIKLFQEKGILHGILGLICGLYTFIWGWLNADRLGIKTIMLIWTGLILLSLVFGGVSTAITASSAAFQ